MSDAAETRGAIPVTTRRLALLALAAAALAACGRRGRPEPPPDADPSYPRIYPTR